MAAGIYPADLTKSLQASHHALFPISVPSHHIPLCVKLIAPREEQAGEETSVSNQTSVICEEVRWHLQVALQHLDNPRKKFLTLSYGREMEAGRGCLVRGGWVVIFEGIRECFTYGVEASKDEYLPTADEAFNVFAPDKVTPSSANARRVATQCFKVVPTTFEIIPDFRDCFLGYSDAGISPPTGTRTRQCGVYGTTRLGHSQSQRKVLSGHHVGQGGSRVTRF